MKTPSKLTSRAAPKVIRYSVGLRSHIGEQIEALARDDERSAGKFIACMVEQELRKSRGRYVIDRDFRIKRY